MRVLLANRGFRYLLAGQFLSLIAPWCQRTMVLIWVFALTQSGTGVSLMGLAEALPMLLLAPVAGVFVDRWDRGRTMTLVVLVQAVVLLPLLTVQGASGVWVILPGHQRSVAVLPVGNCALPVGKRLPLSDRRGSRWPHCDPLDSIAASCRRTRDAKRQRGLSRDTTDGGGCGGVMTRRRAN